MEEIQAIEEEGGLEQLADGHSITTNVVDHEGVSTVLIVGDNSGLTATGQMRSGEQDLEAQWYLSNAHQIPRQLVLQNILKRDHEKQVPLDCFTASF